MTKLITVLKIYSILFWFHLLFESTEYSEIQYNFLNEFTILVFLKNFRHKIYFLNSPDIFDLLSA